MVAEHGASPAVRRRRGIAPAAPTGMAAATTSGGGSSKPERWIRLIARIVVFRVFSATTAPASRRPGRILVSWVPGHSTEQASKHDVIVVDETSTVSLTTMARFRRSRAAGGAGWFLPATLTSWFWQEAGRSWRTWSRG